MINPDSSYGWREKRGSTSGAVGRLIDLVTQQEAGKFFAPAGNELD